MLNRQRVDTGLVIIANLANLLIAGIMLSRPFGLDRLGRVCGITLLVLGIPVIVAIVFNAATGREWWRIALLVPLVIFLLMELLFDYILNLPFRETSLLTPYLVAFYIAVIGMVGYAFSVGKPHGLITVVTYFIQLAATAYSYSQVGHGTG
jgi:hypothetical protein